MCSWVKIKLFFFFLILILWDWQWHPTPALLPGESHGWRSLVGCSPWGREESDTTERLHFHFSLLCIGEGNGNPLQCSCLENPRDGVAQSLTRLKWLSSSSSIRSYYQQAKTILFLPFCFGCLLFLYLASLFQLGLPVLQWIGVVRGGILSLCLILEQTLKFLSIDCHVGYEFVLHTFYDIELYSYYTHSVKDFYHEKNSVKYSFCVYWNDHVIFIVHFIDMMVVV